MEKPNKTSIDINLASWKKDYKFKTSCKNPLKMIGENKKTLLYCELTEKFNPKYEKIDYEVFLFIPNHNLSEIKNNKKFYFLNCFNREYAIQEFHNILNRGKTLEYQLMCKYIEGISYTKNLILKPLIY